MLEIKEQQIQLSNSGKRRNKIEMDLDTAILLAMTACAYCWFIWTGILEEKNENKARAQEEIERLQRAERLKKLGGRS
jgi:hypothetical protein